MARRNVFRAWLYADKLEKSAKYLGVTKTTIREWRTGRSYPHPLRHAALIRAAARVGIVLPPSDLTRHNGDAK